MWKPKKYVDRKGLIEVPEIVWGDYCEDIRSHVYVYHDKVEMLFDFKIKEYNATTDGIVCKFKIKNKDNLIHAIWNYHFYAFAYGYVELRNLEDSSNSISSGYVVLWADYDKETDYFTVYDNDYDCTSNTYLMHVRAFGIC